VIQDDDIHVIEKVKGFVLPQFYCTADTIVMTEEDGQEVILRAHQSGIGGLLPCQRNEVCVCFSLSSFWSKGLSKELKQLFKKIISNRFKNHQLVATNIITYD
jgi:hypothetical protein